MTATPAQLAARVKQALSRIGAARDPQRAAVALDSIGVELVRQMEHVRQRVALQDAVREALDL